MTREFFRILPYAIQKYYARRDLKTFSVLRLEEAVIVIRHKDTTRDEWADLPNAGWTCVVSGASHEKSGMHRLMVQDFKTGETLRSWPHGRHAPGTEEVRNMLRAAFRDAWAEGERPVANTRELQVFLLSPVQTGSMLIGNIQRWKVPY